MHNLAVATVETAVFASEAFRDELKRIARDSDRSLDQVLAEARSHLAEMHSVRSPFAVRLFARMSRYLYRRGYPEEPAFSLDELENIKSLSNERSVVFLVTHKTYLDFFVLFDFLYRHGISTPYIFGGLNMSFAGFGTLARRAGGIFIRRSFRDEAVYKAVLRRYIEHLIEQGSCFMWAIEGTRSRTGKLVMPRLGLLKYVVAASERLDENAISYIPVCVAYDQIPDVADMTAQEAGATKRAESLSWFLEYARRLRGPFGNIIIRFSDALSLTETPDAPDLTSSQRILNKRQIEVQKLAFEVCYRINEVTPPTMTALITMAILCRTNSAVEQLRSDVRLLDDYVSERKPAALVHNLNRFVSHDPDETIELLLENGVIRLSGAGTQPAYSIAPERYLVAIYYANMAVHHFVIRAITEIALLRAAEAWPEDVESHFLSEAMRLRNLLKYEFFFARKDVFRDQLINELGFMSSSWKLIIREGGDAAISLLQRRHLLIGYGVLSPFIAAYRAVAGQVLSSKPGKSCDESEFIDACRAAGRRSVSHHTAEQFAGASKTLLTNGILLAKNRGLFSDDDGQLMEKRKSFANELDVIAGELATIKAMAAGGYTDPGQPAQTERTGAG